MRRRPPKPKVPDRAATPPSGRDLEPTQKLPATGGSDLQRASRLGHQFGGYSISSLAGAAAERIQRVKIFRIQGGSSRQMVTVTGGNITGVDEDDYIYVNIDHELADTWRSKENRQGAQLLVLEVSPTFVQALQNPSVARDHGLLPAQTSQDSKWKGTSYAIKGKKWAAFLKKEQDKGNSKIWDVEEYFAQFEDPPEDHHNVWAYLPGEGPDGFEVSYGDYESYYQEDYEWVSTRVAESKGWA